jgi:hypothetical protein
VRRARLQRVSVGRHATGRGASSATGRRPAPSVG